MKNYVKQRNRLNRVQILAALISFMLMGGVSDQLMAQGPIDKFKPGFSGYIQPAVGIGYQLFLFGKGIIGYAKSESFVYLQSL